jgi:hypothetical protein
VVAGIIGWFFLDLILKSLRTSSSNDEMMPDIMEMSRSVSLWKKRRSVYRGCIKGFGYCGGK